MRARTELPLAAYQVSGEYAMLEGRRRARLARRAARRAGVARSAIRRAGADLIITYYAKDAARWLRGGRTMTGRA